MKPSGPRFRAERCAPCLALQLLAIGHWGAVEGGGDTSFHGFKKQAGKFGKNMSKATEYNINTAGSESPWPAEPQQLGSTLGSSVTWLFWSWDSSQGICCWPLFQPRYRHGFNVSQCVPYSPAAENWAFFFSPEVACEILSLLDSYCWLSRSAEKCFTSLCRLREWEHSFRLKQWENKWRTMEIS